MSTEKQEYKIGDTFYALSGHKVQFVGVDKDGQLMWERVEPEASSTNDANLEL